MAENDDSAKTEEPTSRRLEEGREKGQVALSQEVKSWAILLAGALGVLFLAEHLAGRLLRVGLSVLDQAAGLEVTVASARAALGELVVAVAIATLPILVALVVAALAAGLVQTGLIWAPSRIAPELSKLSPIKGFERLFSGRAIVEFVKGLVKLAAVVVLALTLAMPLLGDMERLPSMSASVIIERIDLLTLRLLGGAVAVMTAMAALDYVYQAWSFTQQMRMTKQEVRDEHKQQEGDPQVKAKIRQLRAQRAQRRMMAAVPDADVVITNPTHFAIALAYDAEAMVAPRCVAKGADELAFRIRDIARAHEVPVVENPPLARALWGTVELDEEIPPEHYHAVAEVIAFVMRLKGKVG